jgi:hypothetical protein
MSTQHNLPKESWKSYFEALSKVLMGKRAEVEVASLELGDQVVGNWLPLLGITYDTRDDLVDVDLSGLNHLIMHPQQIEVSEDTDGIRNVAITAADGTIHVLKMKDPLRLPAATT